MRFTISPNGRSVSTAIGFSSDPGGSKAANWLSSRFGCPLFIFATLSRHRYGGFTMPPPSRTPYTCAQHASGKELETFFENSPSGRPNSARSLEGPPKHRLADRLATWRPAGGFERNDEFPGAGQQARVLRRDGNALAPGGRQEAELMRPGPVRDQEPQLVNASRRSRLVPQRVGRNLMSSASQPDRPDRMPFTVAHDRDNRDVGEIRRVAGDDRGDEQREREGREDPGRPSPYADIGPQFGEPGDFAGCSRSGAVDRHLLSLSRLPSFPHETPVREARSRWVALPSFRDGPKGQARNLGTPSFPVFRRAVFMVSGLAGCARAPE